MSAFIISLLSILLILSSVRAILVKYELRVSLKRLLISISFSSIFVETVLLIDSCIMFSELYP